MIGLLRSYVADFPPPQPVLCHGDFVPEHIFIDHDLDVCGVIDFGMYCGAPQIADLAYLRYALPESDFVAILEGYGAESSQGETFWRRLDLHALGLAIGNLAGEVGNGNVTAASRSADALRAILDRLSGQVPSTQRP